jgi:methylated-DNA-protein-cysteine methyltransferase-like protein
MINAHVLSETDMKRILDEELAYEILSVVEEVPEGRVATYGQIARLIGRRKNSRLVGLVLRRAQYYGDYPCHRIVNHCGRLVPGWAEQKRLLLGEGVFFKNDDHVDLDRCRWEI